MNELIDALNNVGKTNHEHLSAITREERISFNEFLQKQDLSKLMLAKDEHELVCSPVSMSATKILETNQEDAVSSIECKK